MGNGSKIFIAIATLVGLYKLASVIRSVVNLEYYPKNVYLKKVGGKQKLFFSMEIVNPSQKVISIDNFFLGVYSKGKQIGRVIRTEKLDIKPFSTSILIFPITINVGASIYFLYDAVKNKITTVDIDGNITSNGVTYPVFKTIDFTT